MNPERRRKIVADLTTTFSSAGLSPMNAKKAFEVLIQVISRALIQTALERGMLHFTYEKAKDNLKEQPWNIYLRWKIMKAFIDLRRWELKQ